MVWWSQTLTLSPNLWMCHLPKVMEIPSTSVGLSLLWRVLSFRQWQWEVEMLLDVCHNTFLLGMWQSQQGICVVGANKTGKWHGKPKWPMKLTYHKHGIQVFVCIPSTCILTISSSNGIITFSSAICWEGFFLSFFGRCMDAGSPFSCMGSSVLKGKHASSSIQKSQEEGRQADK